MPPAPSPCRLVALLMTVMLIAPLGGAAQGQMDEAPANAGASDSAAPRVTARPETARLTPDQQRDLELLISVLGDTKIDPAKRRDAASSLLARGWPAAIDALARLLNGSGDRSTHTAIARAVSLAANPPTALVDPLLDLLGSDDQVLQAAVAVALGRYEEDRVMNQLIDIASDEAVDRAKRLGAIRALAEYRRAPAVETLVHLLKPGGDREIHAAAGPALQRLTGITRFGGGDPSAWEQWWLEHKHLPHERWLGRLTRTLGVRAQQLEQEKATLTARLTDVYNRLYTATEPAQRPALLQEMLDDATDALRLLALRLIERNLLSAQPISDSTRQAMRAKLDDPNPLVRAKVATLLRDLGDEPAAEQVARRLLPESSPAVQAAYLSLLGRMPQAEAVDPALLLLGRDQVKPAAAAYLVVAADADLFTPAQRIGVLKLAREDLAKSENIEPAVVRLIGRLGGKTDQPTLVELLDHESPAVRRAAAEAFVTGPFDPDLLLAYLDDPQLADKALEAAAKRGASVAVVRTLLAHPPAHDERQAAWRAAIVAVTERLDLEAISAIDERLAEQAERQNLRIAILKTIAQPRPTNGNNQVPVDEPERLELILRLAKLYLQTDQPALARPLFDRLAPASQLPATARSAVRAGRLRATLAIGTIEEAVKLAEQWIAVDPAARAEVGGVLMGAAEAALERQQTEQAAALVARTVQLVGEALDAKDAARLEALRRRLAPVPAAPQSPPPAQTPEP